MNLPIIMGQENTAGCLSKRWLDDPSKACTTGAAKLGKYAFNV
jgi:hypothetical protein